MTHFGRFGGYRKWHLGCPNQNSKTTFQYKYPPKTPILTLWEPFWTPKKCFLAILFILVNLPLKFPLKPKKSTHMGRKGRREKTKTVLKSVNKMEQLAGMSKSKREKIQNKNHPTTTDSVAAIFSSSSCIINLCFLTPSGKLEIIFAM